MAVALWPHQQEALEKLRNGCVLNGGVGSGKTITALAYGVEKVCGGALDRSTPMHTPTDIIVITTARKRDDLDWESEALAFGIFRDPELSYGGINYIIDSWNNIKKYVNVTGAFFIFDEQRLVGSGAWVKTFLKIAKNNQWILLSATPADTWMDYAPLFVANGFYRNRTHFIEEHVVWTYHGKYRKIRGFFGVRHLSQHRDAILVDMPFERHTTRHVVLEEVGFDADLFDVIWRKHWNIYDDVPLIDSGEMHRLARRLVNADASRLEKLRALTNQHPRVIVFYNFDYELDILRTLKSDGMTVAEWNGHKHEPVPDGERWVYLVQYQAGSEAWNCISTNVLVFWSLTYSHKLFEQAQGRIDRLDTMYNDLWYYVLISKSKIDQKIWKSVSTKRTFHEGRVVKFGRETN